MRLSHKLLGLATLALHSIYILWLSSTIRDPIGWVLPAADVAFMSILVLYLFNHWSQNHRTCAVAQPEGRLDVFLPVVNEPFSMFEETLRAALRIDYEPKVVLVLDDGNRQELRGLAERYGVKYLARPTHEDFKAGNLNHGLEHSEGDFVLVLDADQVVTDPAIVRETLGYFVDRPEVGIVTTRQRYDVPAGHFNHDYPFYAHMQPGKDRDNAAISCGSGVVYRRSALEAIGGFQTWNLVEDLYTSYVLHQNGYVSVYLDKAYTLGTAPLDLPTIYKQRGTWALDTLRIFFKRSPATMPGLTLRQRLHYTEMAHHYLVPAVVLPIMFLFSPVVLLLDLHPLDDPRTYVLLRLPGFLLQTLFMYLQAERNLSSTQMWVSLFPVFLKAAVLAPMPFRPRYTVTAKTGEVRRDVRLILPQLAVLAANVVAISWRVSANQTVTGSALIAILWTAMMFFWFAPLFSVSIQPKHRPSTTFETGDRAHRPLTSWLSRVRPEDSTARLSKTAD